MLLTLSEYVPRPPFVIKLLPPVVSELAVWFCIVPLGLVQVAATFAPGTAAPFASLTATIPFTLTWLFFINVPERLMLVLRNAVVGVGVGVGVGEVPLLALRE